MKTKRSHGLELQTKQGGYIRNLPIKELIIAFTLVTFYSITLNKPAQPEVQAKESIKTVQKAPKKAFKRKEVKDVTKKRKQPVEAPRVVQQNNISSNGSCRDWIRSAGITDIESAYILIMKESTCNPNAVNPSSGACGLGQQLPCGKWAHQWNDPVGALKDMNGYVIARYGSWAGALNFHIANSWY